MRTVSLKLAPLMEAILVAAGITVAIGVLPRVLPEKFTSTAIGALFLGATSLLVWRKDDATVRRFGLELGGLVLPGATFSQMARALRTALVWSLGASAVTFFCFSFGFKFWWTRFGHLTSTSAFIWPWTFKTFASTFASQVVMVALPEEAFYRGYLQTRVHEGLALRFAPRAREAVALVATSAVFALGHILTIPNPERLAVFFPSLLFGWLRFRTGGIGAGLLYHAMCNVFSETLGHGYGMY